MPPTPPQTPQRDPYGNPRVPTPAPGTPTTTYPPGGPWAGQQTGPPRTSVTQAPTNPLFDPSNPVPTTPGQGSPRAPAGAPAEVDSGLMARIQQALARVEAQIAQYEQIAQETEPDPDNPGQTVPTLRASNAAQSLENLYDQQIRLLSELSTASRAQPQRGPSPLSNFEPIIDPNTQRQIGLRDPWTGDKIEFDGPVPEGWSDVTLIQNADGTSTYYGYGPVGADGKRGYGPVPGLPTVPKPDKLPPGWGTPYQVTSQDGTRIWYGTNPQTGRPEPIPNMPQVAPTYQPGAREKWVENGQVVEGTWDGQQWRIDTSVRPVPWGAVAEDEQQRILSRAKAGDTRENTIDGRKVVEVSDGQGGWHIDPNRSTFDRVVPREYTPGTINATGADRVITRTDAAGNIINTPNVGYQPKTMADVAHVVGSLQAQAKAEQERLAAKIGQAGYTEEQAGADFQRFWDQTIAPREQELMAAQEQAQYDRQKTETVDRMQAYQYAQQAGTRAIDAYNAQKADRVGPGYQAAVNEIANAFKERRAANVDIGAAVSYDAPDLMKMSEDATARALAMISPTAAQRLGGQPNQLPAGINPMAGLNRANYAFGGMPQAPPPQPMPQPQPQPQPGGLLPPGMAGSNLDPRFQGAVPPWLGTPLQGPQYWADYQFTP